MPGFAAGLNGVTTLYTGSSTGAPTSGADAATCRKSLRSTAVSLYRTFGAGQSAAVLQDPGGAANKVAAEPMCERTLIACSGFGIESPDITLVTRPNIPHLKEFHDTSSSP